MNKPSHFPNLTTPRFQHLGLEPKTHTTSITYNLYIYIYIYVKVGVSPTFKVTSAAMDYSHDTKSGNMWPLDFVFIFVEKWNYGPSMDFYLGWFYGKPHLLGLPHIPPRCGHYIVWFDLMSPTHTCIFIIKKL